MIVIIVYMEIFAKKDFVLNVWVITNVIETLLEIHAIMDVVHLVIMIYIVKIIYLETFAIYNLVRVVNVNMMYNVKIIHLELFVIPKTFVVNVKNNKIAIMMKFVKKMDFVKKCK